MYSTIKEAISWSVTLFSGRVLGVEAGIYTFENSHQGAVIRIVDFSYRGNGATSRQGRVATYQLPDLRYEYPLQPGGKWHGVVTKWLCAGHGLTVGRQI